VFAHDADLVLDLLLLPSSIHAVGSIRYPNRMAVRWEKASLTGLF
jgi:hypothetical protein